jgi:hypothetical protein
MTDEPVVNVVHVVPGDFISEPEAIVVVRDPLSRSRHGCDTADDVRRVRVVPYPIDKADIVGAVAAAVVGLYAGGIALADSGLPTGGDNPSPSAMGSRLDRQCLEGQSNCVVEARASAARKRHRVADRR